MLGGKVEEVEVRIYKDLQISKCNGKPMEYWVLRKRGKEYDLI